MSVQIKGHKEPSFYLAFTGAPVIFLLIMKTTNAKAITCIYFTLSHAEFEKTEMNVLILC